MNDISKVVWKPSTHSRIVAEHKCTRFPTRNLTNTYDNSIVIKYDDRWYFVGDIYADEDTVTNLQLQKVGEYVCGGGFQVIYCPYCGKRLDEDNPCEVSLYE